MFAKTTTIFALLSVAVQSVVATPPACLIGAISTASDPSDISSICKSPSSVQSYLNSKCGNTQQQAISAFASVCSGAGVTIDTSSFSSSSSSSSSSSVSQTASNSASASMSSAGTSGAASSTDMPSSSDSSSMTTSNSAGTTATVSNTMVTSTVAATTTVAASGSNTPSTTTSATTKSSTGAAARLGMDCVGLAALGAFGAMLAL